ncbi:hypothetical protein GUJ93_ZPchr0007g5064 [Zizania palustris]|uniref:Uncharacterized protein n=1 Tax=Zizania palustris TaxID=103762 RepID=A0A8J5VXP7_ZIZPA|nr:hypothetical protein GUJ93_ZPchr0007g5064 [Zizania palustris]
MQGVARVVARSARAAAAAAEGYHSRRCFGGGGAGASGLKASRSVRGAARMAEEATRRAASQAEKAAPAQGERFWTGYCVVVYGGLLGEVLRRFKGYHDEATAASSLQLIGSVTADY